MFKVIFHDSLKISKFTMICMENHLSMPGWQKLFSHTNPSNFRQPLQSLPLRHMADNLQVIQFQYALPVPANKIFQK